MAEMDLNFTSEEIVFFASFYSQIKKSNIELCRKDGIEYNPDNDSEYLYINLVGEPFMENLMKFPEGEIKEQVKNSLSGVIINFFNGPILGGAVLGPMKSIIPSDMNTGFASRELSSLDKTNNISRDKLLIVPTEGNDSSSNLKDYVSSPEKFRKLLPMLFVSEDFFTQEEITKILSKINHSGGKMIGGNKGNIIILTLLVILSLFSISIFKPFEGLTATPSATPSAAPSATPSAAPSATQFASNLYKRVASFVTPSSMASDSGTPLSTEIRLDDHKELLNIILDIIQDSNELQAIANENSANSINTTSAEATDRFNKLNEKVLQIMPKIDNLSRTLANSNQETIMELKGIIGNEFDNSTSIVVSSITESWGNATQAIKMMNTSTLDLSDTIESNFELLNTSIGQILNDVNKLKMELNQRCESQSLAVCPDIPEYIDGAKNYAVELRKVSKSCETGKDQSRMVGLKEGRMVCNIEVQTLQGQISNLQSQLLVKTEQLKVKTEQLNEQQAKQENITDKNIEIQALKGEINELEAKIILLISKVNTYNISTYIVGGCTLLLISLCIYYSQQIKKFFKGVFGMTPAQPKSRDEGIVAQRFVASNNEKVTKENQRRSDSVNKRALAREEALRKEDEKKQLRKLTREDREAVNTLANLSSSGSNGGQKRKTRKRGKRLTKRRQLRNKRRTGKKVLKKSKKNRKYRN